MKTTKLVLAMAFIMISHFMYAQNFEINSKESTVKWVGKKIGGEHSGEIQLKSGKLEIKDNKIVSGNFVIDMASITNTDLESEEYSQKLVRHLKSDDFFGVEKFPTATLIISEGTNFVDGVAKVNGKLTLKGKTNPISFEVKKGNDEYSSTIVVDRSEYDVRYGSKSFFDNLGDKVIHDKFTLEVLLVVK